MFSAPPDALLRVVIVSLCAYAGLILILRASGKRSLAKLNAFDFVVTVAFGSTLATILLSKDVSLAEGMLALGMLAGLQYLISKLSLLLPPFRRAIRSAPTLLLEDGAWLDGAMAHERVTRSEIEAAIRKQGIGRIEDVAAVVLETDGSFSVIARAEDAKLTALKSVRRIGTAVKGPR